LGGNDTTCIIYMLYVYHGDDVTKLRTEAFSEALTHAGVEGEVETLSEENASEVTLRDALGATSLFREREVYILDTLSRNEEVFGALMSMLPELSESENVFVVIEEKLGVKDEKKFTEVAHTIKHFPRPPQKEFNVFALTDALALRDKKSLWILLVEAWREGKSSEEIIGTLLWQLKTIRLALQTKSAVDAGLKPFVYEKALRAQKKFSKEELVERAHSLVMLYHEGHAGKRDIDRALERWVLKL